MLSLVLTWVACGVWWIAMQVGRRLQKWPRNLLLEFCCHILVFGCSRGSCAREEQRCEQTGHMDCD